MAQMQHEEINVQADFMVGTHGCFARAVRQIQCIQRARSRTRQVERIQHALLRHRLLPRLPEQLLGGVACYLPGRFPKGTADAATEAADRRYLPGRFRKGIADAVAEIDLAVAAA